jgi:hypothetical protein
MRERRAAAAARNVRFSEIAEAAGVDHRWPEIPRPLKILHAFGAGCALLYFDDRWQDVLSVAEPHPRLYRNVGKAARCEEVTAKAGFGGLNGDWKR